VVIWSGKKAGGKRRSRNYERQTSAPYSLRSFMVGEASSSRCPLVPRSQDQSTEGKGLKKGKKLADAKLLTFGDTGGRTAREQVAEELARTSKLFRSRKSRKRRKEGGERK